jgi:hypothetical protein
MDTELLIHTTMSFRAELTGAKPLSNNLTSAIATINPKNMVRLRTKTETENVNLRATFLIIAVEVAAINGPSEPVAVGNGTLSRGHILLPSPCASATHNHIALSDFPGGKSDYWICKTYATTAREQK